MTKNEATWQAFLAMLAGGKPLDHAVRRAKDAVEVFEESVCLVGELEGAGLRPPPSKVVLPKEAPKPPPPKGARKKRATKKKASKKGGAK